RGSPPRRKENMEVSAEAMGPTFPGDGWAPARGPAGALPSGTLPARPKAGRSSPIIESIGRLVGERAHRVPGPGEGAAPENPAAMPGWRQLRGEAGPPGRRGRAPGPNPQFKNPAAGSDSRTRGSVYPGSSPCP